MESPKPIQDSKILHRLYDQITSVSFLPSSFETASALRSILIIPHVFSYSSTVILYMEIFVSFSFLYLFDKKLSLSCNYCKEK